MTPYRIFVEKREPYRVEAESLRNELNSNLGLNISDLRMLCVYDLFGFSAELVEKSSYKVFGEPATDTVAKEADFEGRPYLAIESLPGQFDQRAAAAEECVKLIQPDADIEIRSAKLLIFDCSVGAEEMKKIEHYCINAVESRKRPFCACRSGKSRRKTCGRARRIQGNHRRAGPGMVQREGTGHEWRRPHGGGEIFHRRGRDPNETELRILDTYWSDHCRHTTFTTELTDIKVDDSFASADLEESLRQWMEIRKELGREKQAAVPNGPRHYRRPLSPQNRNARRPRTERREQCLQHICGCRRRRRNREMAAAVQKTRRTTILRKSSLSAGPRHVWEVQSATR